MIRRVTFLAALGISLAVLAACSDRPYGALFCPAGPRDTLVVYPRLEFRQIEIYGDTLATEDHDPGMAGTQCLYLGSDGEAGSSILVDFDFGHLFSEEFPPQMFTLDNIKSVKFSLMKFRSYSAYKDSVFSYLDSTYVAHTPTGNPIDLYYVIRELVGPFDPATYLRPPGPVPATNSTILNSDFDTPNDADESYLRLYEDDFIRWVEAGEIVGLEVALDPRSDPGLVGYASRETRWFHDLPLIDYGSVPAPCLLVEFVDNSIWVILPLHDTSTFEELPVADPGAMEIRTGIDTYPVLTFDLPDLPEGNCLDHCLLRLGTPGPGESSRDVVYWSTLDLAGLDLSSGLVLEDDLARIRTRTFSATPDTLPSPENAYDYPVSPGTDPRAVFYPWPERLDLVLGPYPNRYNYPYGPPIYYSRRFLEGPSAPEDRRPALLVIYGRKGED